MNLIKRLFAHPEAKSDLVILMAGGTAASVMYDVGSKWHDGETQHGLRSLRDGMLLGAMGGIGMSAIILCKPFNAYLFNYVLFTGVSLTRSTFHLNDSYAELGKSTYELNKKYEKLGREYEAFCEKEAERVNAKT
jgi:hypothetical protein